MAKKKIVAIMPAYNAARTLEKTISDIPAGSVDEIILVDDASTDNTAEIAKKLGLHVVVHPENRGYGANQKTCYNEALKIGADIIVMIHPDYQYDSRLTPFITGFIEAGICDIILGSRIRTRKETLEGGMPIYKYISNRFLTAFENIALGQNIGDFHTGFRAYSRTTLESIPYQYNSDGFVFDTQFLIEAIYFGFKIGDVPVPVRYYDDSSSINFKNSLIYGLKTLQALSCFYFQKLGIRKYKYFEQKK